LVFSIPLNCAPQGSDEVLLWFPSESLKLVRGHAVSSIVGALARVFDVDDQVSISTGLLQKNFENLKVGPLVDVTDVVSLTDKTVLQDVEHSSGMILRVDPLSNLTAVPV
jgi:hypothetical protein